jgi:sulfur-oxidizing protein SoxX
MKQGEKTILLIIAACLAVVGGIRLYTSVHNKQIDKGIPFYSTASPALAHEAEILYEHNNCSDCHTLWATRDMMQNVPSPMLDGIGSLRSETWFYKYFSAKNPQAILPSRLKKKYQMPSYAQLPEHQRRVLAQYMASLKVKNWYLEQTRKAEYEKLTGKPYKQTKAP